MDEMSDANRSQVDIAPFAARVVQEDPHEYALWWEDPRDIHGVRVTFADEVPVDRLPALHYWRRNWPKVRVPQNAVIGAGNQGWLALDDWITGQWQEAATTVEGAGRSWTYAFRPLDAEAIPDAAGFPVSFRRALKLRLYGQAALPPIEHIAVYTDSAWREAEVCLEWGGNASDEAPLGWPSGGL